MSRNFTDAFQSLDKSQRMLLLDEDTKRKSNDLFPIYTKQDYLPRKLDPKQRFLGELLPASKRKRGKDLVVDLKHMFSQKRPTMSMYRKIKALPIKLIQFHENVRPAYYGTWTKATHCITGRTPFAKDDMLDYEYDSEAEWELDEGDDIHSMIEDDDLVFPDSEDEEEKSNNVNNRKREWYSLFTHTM
jgi:hypothetical protein